MLYNYNYKNFRVSTEQNIEMDSVWKGVVSAEESNK
jgi:hypothetical protein